MGNRNRFLPAFTLAEMMVVLLIMSIIMAAMAPVMTTRMKSDKSNNSSPWKWSNGGVGPNAYFATQPSPKAIIGMNNASDEDNGRLIINTQNDYAHILFKRDGNTLAKLLVNNNNSLFLNNYNGDFSAMSNSTALGIGSLINNAGDENTAIGSNALSSNTEGSRNTAIGSEAMYSNSTGINNTAIGENALTANESGSQNTAVGTQALMGNTASNNTALGYNALSAAVSGANNTALGSGALSKNTTGTGNVAVGSDALSRNTIGYGNVAIGSGYTTDDEQREGSLSHNTTGHNNIAIGTEALLNTYGNGNIGIGYRTLVTNAGGGGAVAIGSNALEYNKGAYYKNNVYTATWNVAIGMYAMRSEGSKSGRGHEDVAVGPFAMRYLDDGNNNTAIGNASLYRLENGHYNTAVGSDSLEGIINGKNNTAVGYMSQFSGDKDGNTSVGAGALFRSTGTNNTAIGYLACNPDLDIEKHLYTDSNGVLQYTGPVISGSNVTCIGAGSGPKTDAQRAQSNVVYIGTENDTVYIPGNLVVGKSALFNVEAGYSTAIRSRAGEQFSNVFTQFEIEGDNEIDGLHSEDATGKKLETLINTFSDRRLKYVGSENKSGLDKIKQLKVFNYTFKKDPKKTPRVGVIAQDLQKIFPNAVTKGKDGFLMIRMEDMFYALVNAVKELDAKINVILSETKDLKKQVTEILRSAQNDKKQAQIDREILKQVQNDNKQLKKENAELKQTLKQVHGDNKELKARLERLEQKLK